MLAQVHLARLELGHGGVDDDTTAVQDDHLVGPMVVSPPPLLPEARAQVIRHP